MQKPTFDPGLTQQYTGNLRRAINKDGTFNWLSAGICKIGPFYATFFILLTAMNSTLVTACRLAFSSR